MLQLMRCLTLVIEYLNSKLLRLAFTAVTLDNCIYLCHLFKFRQNHSYIKTSNLLKSGSSMTFTFSSFKPTRNKIPTHLELNVRKSPLPPGVVIQRNVNIFKASKLSEDFSKFIRSGSVRKISKDQRAVWFSTVSGHDKMRQDFRG